MRPIKTTTISILAIGLLAGPAVSVAAQDEEAAAEDPAGAAYFTGEIGSAGAVVAEPEETIVDGVLEGRGLVYEGETIETSDPRITGSLSMVLNANIHKLDDFEDVLAQTFVLRIENDDGSWTGQGTALVHGGAGFTRDETTDFGTVLFTGEGGYEGLSAYLLGDWTEEPIAVEGAVFPGEIPPFPEFPAEEPAPDE